MNKKQVVEEMANYIINKLALTEEDFTHYNCLMCSCEICNKRGDFMAQRVDPEAYRDIIRDLFNSIKMEIPYPVKVCSLVCYKETLIRHLLLYDNYLKLL